MFIAAVFITSRILKQPVCPSISEWINTLGYKYSLIQKREYFNNNKKLAIILNQDKTWMNLKCILQSKSSQSENFTFLYD